MRTHKMLPNYLLEADGTAIDKRTGEVIELITKTEYRLETAETVFLELKNKTINLVRRFTREQLVRLYNEADEVNDVSENTGKTPKVNKVNTSNSPKNADLVTKVNSLEVNSEQKEQGVYLNGERFESLSHASEATGINKSTINKRIQSDNFPTYYRIE